MPRTVQTGADGWYQLRKRGDQPITPADAFACPVRLRPPTACCFYAVWKRSSTRLGFGRPLGPQLLAASARTDAAREPLWTPLTASSLRYAMAT